MKKFLLIIKENWKDPVWSKVIAAAIISVFGFIIASFYSLITSVYYSIPFKEAISNLGILLNRSLELKVWLLLLLIFIYLILVFSPLLEFVENVIFKIKNTNKSKKNTTLQQLPRAPRHSTSFFDQRMASAFPGTRKITWFENSKDAIHRLEKLLEKPINFSSRNTNFNSQGINSESRPIWWFRGGRSMYIERFQRIGFLRRIVLMNDDRLRVKRIASYHGSSYYKDFVYVELEGEKQTGLYDYNDEDVTRHKESFGFMKEEYGIIKNKIGWKVPIRREDYDDGATVIRSKVRNARDAKLRVRFLTNYNFIIAAKGSPYNSLRFNKNSKSIFDRILKNEAEPNELFKFLKGFKKHEGKLI